MVKMFKLFYNCFICNLLHLQKWKFGQRVSLLALYRALSGHFRAGSYILTHTTYISQVYLNAKATPEPR